MNLPSKELVSRPLVTRSIFHRILQTGLFGNHINTKKQVSNHSSSRENCAFLHAPSLRLDDSGIRELAIIRRLRLPAHSKRSAGLQPRKPAPRFGVRPLPPLKTLRFKSAPESRGANSPGTAPQLVLITKRNSATSRCCSTRCEALRVA